MSSLSKEEEEKSNTEDSEREGDKTFILEKQSEFSTIIQENSANKTKLSATLN